MVDVREVLVLMGEHHVPMLLTRNDFDRQRRVVLVARIDRMRVHEHFVGVTVSVVSGAHDQHADQ